MSKLKLDNVTLIVIEGRNSHMDMTLKKQKIYVNGILILM